MKRHVHRSGGVRLSLRHEMWIYVIGGLLLVSGVGWLVVHYLLASVGQFGEVHHASEHWWLRLHGAAASGFLMVCGTLLPVHVVPALHWGKNRSTGVLMLAVVALLVVTSYGLYYVVGDSWRSWISAIHWATGLGAIAGLGTHVWMGKRHRSHHRRASHSDATRDTNHNEFNR